jgi:uncharacterized protein YodC (DUF2158 family)
VKLNKGDIVQLKTGSRSMVVISVEGSIAQCAWYDARQQIRGEFPVESLEEISSFTFCEVARPIVE